MAKAEEDLKPSHHSAINDGVIGKREKQTLATPSFKVVKISNPINSGLQGRETKPPNSVL